MGPLPVGRRGDAGPLAPLSSRVATPSAVVCVADGWQGAGMTTSRSPEDVFAHHGVALGAEDLEDIVSDYADDAVLVVQRRVYRGQDGAREVFTQLLRDVPQASWTLDTTFADDVLYLEWKAAGGGNRVDDGWTRSCSGTAGSRSRRSGTPSTRPDARPRG